MNNKLSKLLLIKLSLISSMYASQTMCYKENITSLAQLETTNLDGGECKSQFTINQMKKNSWDVKDIKITPKANKYNVVYILEKKASTQITSNIKIDTKIEKKLNTDLSLDEKIELKIKEQVEKKEKEKEEKIIAEKKDKAKNIYISKCQECHGKKAEEEAYNTARALNSLSYEEMEKSIIGYRFGEEGYTSGNSIIMKPYTTYLYGENLKEVYDYIQTLK